MDPLARRAERPLARGSPFPLAAANSYSLDGWLGAPKRAPKAMQTASPAVAALIEGVAAARLQAHVEALALKDPALGSVSGNSRSRFAVHPEMLESTEYIRAQLAASLGDEAVELHSFPIDSRRVISHTSRRGNPVQAPIDTTAYNVIATLSGTDPEAGYYIVCAHYDATGTRSAGGWTGNAIPRLGRRQCHRRGLSPRERETAGRAAVSLVHPIYSLVRRGTGAVGQPGVCRLSR